MKNSNEWLKMKLNILWLLDPIHKLFHQDRLLFSFSFHHLAIVLFVPVELSSWENLHLHDCKLLNEQYIDMYNLVRFFCLDYFINTTFIMGWATFIIRHLSKKNRIPRKGIFKIEELRNVNKKSREERKMYSLWKVSNWILTRFEELLKHPSPVQNFVQQVMSFNYVHD